jgi:ectoine hydroxylase-related dioxygenase (phytanoyl-CoA dioxygenase family)
MIDKNFFKDHGYTKFSSIPLKVLTNLKLTLFEMLKVSYKKYIGTLDDRLDLSLEDANRIFIELENQNHAHITKIFDSVRTTSAFLQLVNNELHLKCCRDLLSANSQSSMFLNSLSIRMDPPNSTNFSYGWHTDSDVNVNKSEFVQAWIPLVDINESLGGLEIIKNSHVSEFKTEHTDHVNKAVRNGKKHLDPLVYRLPHATKIITPGAEELVLTANFGETIFFSNKLMHRSGLNRTKNKVRLAVTAFYHRSDVLDSDWY